MGTSATFVKRSPIIVVTIPRYTEQFGAISERYDLSIEDARGLWVQINDALEEAEK